VKKVVSALKSLCRCWKQHIEQNSVRLDDQKETLNNQEKTLNSQEKTLSKLEKVVSDQLLLIQKQEKALNGQEKILSNLEKVMSDQSGLIQNQKETLNSQQQTLSKLEKAVSDQSRLIQNQEKTLNSQEKTLNSQEKTLNSQEKMLSNLEKMVSDQSRLIQNMGKENVDLKNQISRSSSHDSSVNTQLEVINRDLNFLQRYAKLSFCNIDEIVRSFTTSSSATLGNMKLYRDQDTIVVEVNPVSYNPWAALIFVVRGITSYTLTFPAKYRGSRSMSPNAIPSWSLTSLIDGPHGLPGYGSNGWKAAGFFAGKIYHPHDAQTPVTGTGYLSFGDSLTTAVNYQSKTFLFEFKQRGYSKTYTTSFSDVNMGSGDAGLYPAFCITNKVTFVLSDFKC